VPGVSFGESPDLTSPAVVLGARQAKGLEFDSVLVADPAAILAGSPRGRNDLYVAMTRSTQRLGVLHPGRPPAELAETLTCRPWPDGSRRPVDEPTAGGDESGGAQSSEWRESRGSEAW
jgi:hypothetical protein